MPMMKRMREEDREVEALAMANCLRLLSRVGATAGSTGGGGRVFACKTCHREFLSFQALGGHRASHKKPRLMGGGDDLHVDSPAKPKSHECLICGAEFPIGQALGGHMRRHRLNNALSTHSGTDSSRSTGSSNSEEAVPVLKKSNSSSSSRSKRVSLCLDLDLNLTPHENHIKKINALSLTSRLIA